MGAGVTVVGTGEWCRRSTRIRSACHIFRYGRSRGAPGGILLLRLGRWLDLYLGFGSGVRSSSGRCGFGVSVLRRLAVIQAPHLHLDNFDGAIVRLAQLCPPLQHSENAEYQDRRCSQPNPPSPTRRFFDAERSASASTGGTSLSPRKDGPAMGVADSTGLGGVGGSLKSRKRGRSLRCSASLSTSNPSRSRTSSSAGVGGASAAGGGVASAEGLAVSTDVTEVVFGGAGSSGSKTAVSPRMRRLVRLTGWHVAEILNILVQWDFRHKIELRRLRFRAQRLGARYRGKAVSS